MHEVLVNRLGGLSLPRKSVVRLTDNPDMTLDVYRGRETTIQQQQLCVMRAKEQGFFLRAKQSQTLVCPYGQPYHLIRLTESINTSSDADVVYWR